MSATYEDEDGVLNQNGGVCDLPETLAQRLVTEATTKSDISNLTLWDLQPPPTPLTDITTVEDDDDDDVQEVTAEMVELGNPKTLTNQNSSPQQTAKTLPNSISSPKLNAKELTKPNTSPQPTAKRLSNKNASQEPTQKKLNNPNSSLQLSPKKLANLISNLQSMANSSPQLTSKKLTNPNSSLQSTLKKLTNPNSSPQLTSKKLTNPNSSPQLMPKKLTNPNSSTKSTTNSLPQSTTKKPTNQNSNVQSSWSTANSSPQSSAKKLSNPNSNPQSTPKKLSNPNFNVQSTATANSSQQSTPKTPSNPNSSQKTSQFRTHTLNQLISKLKERTPVPVEKTSEVDSIPDHRNLHTSKKITQRWSAQVEQKTSHKARVLHGEEISTHQKKASTEEVPFGYANAPQPTIDLVPKPSQLKRRGRQKGSKNKEQKRTKGSGRPKGSRDKQRRKTGAGRPKGSKNKRPRRKTDSDESEAEDVQLTKRTRAEPSPLSLCNLCGCVTVDGVHIDRECKGKKKALNSSNYVNFQVKDSEKASNKGNIPTEMYPNLVHFEVKITEHASMQVGGNSSSDCIGHQDGRQPSNALTTRGSGDSSSDCDDLEEDIESYANVATNLEHERFESSRPAQADNCESEESYTSESEISDLTESESEDEEGDELPARSSSHQALLTASPLNNSPSYKCKHCDQIWTSRVLLEQHEQMHQHKTYNCEFCKKDIPVEERRSHHLKHAELMPLSHEQELNSCQFCGFQASNMLNLNAHIAGQHRNDTTVTGKTLAITKNDKPKKSPTARKSTAKQHHAIRNDEPSHLDDRQDEELDNNQGDIDQNVELSNKKLEAGGNIERKTTTKMIKVKFVTSKSILGSQVGLQSVEKLHEAKQQIIKTKLNQGEIQSGEQLKTHQQYPCQTEVNQGSVKSRKQLLETHQQHPAQTELIQGSFKSCEQLLETHQQFPAQTELNQGSVNSREQLLKTHQQFPAQTELIQGSVNSREQLLKTHQQFPAETELNQGSVNSREQLLETHQLFPAQTKLNRGRLLLKSSEQLLHACQQFQAQTELNQGRLQSGEQLPETHQQHPAQTEVNQGELQSSLPKTHQQFPAQTEVNQGSVKSHEQLLKTHQLFPAQTKVNRGRIQSGEQLHKAHQQHPRQMELNHGRLKSHEQLLKTHQVFPAQPELNQGRARPEQSSEQLLPAHQQFSSQKLLNHCKLCNKFYSSTDSLVRHLCIPTCNPPVTCQLCNTIWLSDDVLREHMKVHINPCKVCRDIFVSQSALAAHKRMYHRVRKKKTKKAAEQTGKTKQATKKPCKTKKATGNKKATGERVENSKFQCKFCQKYYSGANSLQRHVRIHTGEKPFACQYCDRQYSDKSNCNQHEKRCDQNGIDRRNVEGQQGVEELGKNGDEDSNKEGSIGEASNKEGSISEDSNKEGSIGEDSNKEGGVGYQQTKKQERSKKGKLYLGRMGGKSGKQREKGTLNRQQGVKSKKRALATLAAHMKMKTKKATEQTGKTKQATKKPCKTKKATGERVDNSKFQCKFCQKYYSGANSLLRHVRIHTGEKPFACQHCDRQFSDKSNCNQHEKRCVQVEIDKRNIEAQMGEDGDGDSNKEGSIGEDSNKEGSIGENSNKEGSIGEDSNKEGSIGENSNKEGSIGEDSNKEGSIGKDSNKEGSIGEDSNKEGSIGEDSNKEGSIGHQQTEKQERSKKGKLYLGRMEGKSGKQREKGTLNRQLAAHMKMYRRVKKKKTQKATEQTGEAKQATKKTCKTKKATGDSVEDSKFQCKFCKKYYSGCNSLERHVRIHTGEKPFACQYCDRRFSDKSNCNQHEKRCCQVGINKKNLECQQGVKKMGEDGDGDSNKEGSIGEDANKEGGVGYQRTEKHERSKKGKLYLGRMEGKLGKQREKGTLNRQQGAKSKKRALTTNISQKASAINKNSDTAKGGDTNQVMLGKQSDQRDDLMQRYPDIDATTSNEMSVDDVALILKYLLKNGIGKYTCVTCRQRSVEDINIMVDHILTRHGLTVGLYSCTQCPEQFVYKGRLTRHIKYSHQPNPKEQCSRCKKHFYSYGHFKLHLITCSKNTSRGVFQCKDCSKAFAKKSSLKRHSWMHLHGGKRRFPCGICKKKFGNQGSCKNHETSCARKALERKRKEGGEASEKVSVRRKITPRGVFQCKVCSKAFAKKSSLKRHSWMHLHGGKRRFPCGICKKKFGNQGSCKKHEMSCARKALERKREEGLSGEGSATKKIQMVSTMEPEFVKKQTSSDDIDNSDKNEFEMSEGGNEEGISEVARERVQLVLSNELTNPEIKPLTEEQQSKSIVRSGQSVEISEEECNAEKMALTNELETSGNKCGKSKSEVSVRNDFEVPGKECTTSEGQSGLTNESKFSSNKPSAERQGGEGESSRRAEVQAGESSSTNHVGVKQEKGTAVKMQILGYGLKSPGKESGFDVATSPRIGDLVSTIMTSGNRLQRDQISHNVKQIDCVEWNSQLFVKRIDASEGSVEKEDSCYETEDEKEEGEMGSTEEIKIELVDERTNKEVTGEERMEEGRVKEEAEGGMEEGTEKEGREEMGMEEEKEEGRVKEETEEGGMEGVEGTGDVDPKNVLNEEENAQRKVTKKVAPSGEGEAFLDEVPVGNQQENARNAAMEEGPTGDKVQIVEATSTLSPEQNANLLSHECVCEYCIESKDMGITSEQCPRCGESYTEKILHDLIRHLSYQLKQTFTCKTCEQKFSRKCQVIKHERAMHHMVAADQCSQCRVVSQSVSIMLRHEMKCWTERNIFSIVEPIGSSSEVSSPSTKQSAQPVEGSVDGNGQEMSNLVKTEETKQNVSLLVEPVGSSSEVSSPSTMSVKQAAQLVQGTADGNGQEMHNVMKTEGAEQNVSSLVEPIGSSSEVSLPSTMSVKQSTQPVQGTVDGNVQEMHNLVKAEETEELLETALTSTSKQTGHGVVDAAGMANGIETPLSDKKQPLESAPGLEMGSISDPETPLHQGVANLDDTLMLENLKQNRQGRYYCKICRQKAVPNRQIVMDHIRQRHNKLHKCVKCSECLPSQILWIRHVKRCHVSCDSPKKGTEVADSSKNVSQKQRSPKGRFLSKTTHGNGNLEYTNNSPRIEASAETSSDYEIQKQRCLTNKISVCLPVPPRRQSAVSPSRQSPVSRPRQSGKFNEAFSSKRCSRCHKIFPDVATVVIHEENCWAGSLAGGTFDRSDGELQESVPKSKRTTLVQPSHLESSLMDPPREEFDLDRESSMQPSLVKHNTNTASHGSEEFPSTGIASGSGSATSKKQIKQSNTCRFCVKMFNSALKCKYHERMMHAGEFRELQNMEKKSIVKDEFRCHLCNINFANKSNLKRHNMTLHTAPPTRGDVRHEDGVRCQICLKNFAHKNSLQRHMILHTGDKAKDFRCRFCHRYLADIQSLQQHMLLHNAKKDKGPSCRICHIHFADNHSLQRHTRLHKDKKDKGNFQCNICRGHFADKDMLQRHKRLHKSNKEQGLLCHICRGHFADRYSLRRHMIRFHNFKRSNGKLPKSVPKPKLTSLVPQSYLEPTLVDTPKEGKDFSCRVCRQNFTDNQNLQKHITTCPVDKDDSKCRYCNKFFRDKASVARHERIHTGVKPYSCNKCGKAFSDSGNCSKHQRRCLKTTKLGNNRIGNQKKCKSVLKDMNSTLKPKESSLKRSNPSLGDSLAGSSASPSTAHWKIEPAACTSQPADGTVVVRKKIHKKVNSTKNMKSKHGQQIKNNLGKRANMKLSKINGQYQCPFCEKLFSYPNSVKRHMRIHTGHAPYACTCCRRRFTDDSNRISHERRCKNELISQKFAANQKIHSGGGFKAKGQTGSWKIAGLNSSQKLPDPKSHRMKCKEKSPQNLTAIKKTTKKAGMKTPAFPKKLNTKTENQLKFNDFSKQYKCRLCKVGYDFPSDFERHVLSKRHQEIIQSKDRHVCTFCNIGFNWSSDLERHNSSKRHLETLKKVAKLCH